MCLLMQASGLERIGLFVSFYLTSMMLQAAPLLVVHEFDGRCSAPALTYGCMYVCAFTRVVIVAQAVVHACNKHKRYYVKSFPGCLHHGLNVSVPPVCRRGAGPRAFVCLDICPRPAASWSDLHYKPWRSIRSHHIQQVRLNIKGFKPVYTTQPVAPEVD
jgi:hypothetical protein